MMGRRKDDGEREEMMTRKEREKGRYKKTRFR